MKSILSLFILALLSCGQKVYNLDKKRLIHHFDIKSELAYFQKNSWAEFKGVYLESTDSTYRVTKVKNGIPQYSEIYGKDWKFLDYISRSKERLKAKIKYLKDSEDLVNIDSLRVEFLQVHYRLKKYQITSKRLTGILKQNKEKCYYQNGALTKCEIFHDLDCRRIASRKTYFHTQAGNIVNEPSDKKLHYSNFCEEWDQNGKLIFRAECDRRGYN
jgi:hypothetical protein